MNTELQSLTKKRSEFYHYLTSSKDLSRATKKAVIEKIASIDKRIKEIVKQVTH